MTGTIGVGFVGASAARGWALTAHLPGLQANPAYEVRAVSASTRDRAEAAAVAFGAARAVDSNLALVSAPEVDLVVVTVKAPKHHAVVMAALEAGKMVFCEWPLGRNLAEAQEMASLAEARGIPTMIGLQNRCSEVVRYLRDLIAEGYVGTVLSTVVVGSGIVFNGTVDSANEYSRDASSGASLLSVPAGHAVDALCFALGEFDNVSANLVMRHKMVVRNDDGALLPNATPDQISFSGTLESGALATVHYRGGPCKGDDFVWEINGTEGDIVLSIENGRLSSPGLKIRGSRGKEPLADLVVPDSYRLVPPGTPEGQCYNVAALYAQFAQDRRDGTRIAPDFADALRRHRLIDAIERAGATGVRQSLHAA